MKKIICISLLLAFGIFTSCNNDDTTQSLRGIYKEVSPINGRSQLNFIDGHTVIKSEPEYYTEDKFTYELIGDLIKLTSTSENPITSEFEIYIINSSKFEIENIYPSIPENPTSYMTFEK